MRRLTQHRLVAAAAVALATVACGSSSTSSTPSTPTTPTASTTETFSGTITANGGHTYPFNSSSGTLTLTLTTVAPVSTTPIGISLGTWSGVSCTVGTGLFNDAATQGTSITGQVSTIGSLCARVYDGAGLLTAPTTYTITVVHP
jgi:hypothetical protein